MCGVWFDQEEEVVVVTMLVQTEIELRLHIPAVGPGQLAKTGRHAQTHMLQDWHIEH